MLRNFTHTSHLRMEKGIKVNYLEVENKIAVTTSRECVKRKTRVQMYKGAGMWTEKYRERMLGCVSWEL